MQVACVKCAIDKVGGQTATLFLNPENARHSAVLPLDGHLWYSASMDARRTHLWHTALCLCSLALIGNIACAAVGKTLGEWLAKAEEIGAVRCADFASSPRAYAQCMGDAGSDAAVIVAAGRLRDAVRRALDAAVPGAGAEDADAEREAARVELAEAVKQWESLHK